jgi:simple sugar transport system permease protein
MLDVIRSSALTRRQDVPWLLRAGAFAGGLALGLFLTVIILLISGVPFGSIINEFIIQVFFDSAGLAQTTLTATPLILVGLGAAAAMKLQFWNIGLEGQVWMGAIGATAVAFYDIGPDSLRLYIMLLAAIAGGAAWIAIPVFFKLRYSVNEIIMTLLLAYVVFQVVEHLLFGAWQDPKASFPVSPHFGNEERLSRIGWGSVHSGLWVALLCGALMWVLMERSRFGYYATAVGNNLVASKATGLPVVATIVIAVLLSGGLAGLAGGVIVAGTEYRLTQFVGHGYTFSGIVIAFIARFRPAFVVIAAFVIGGVYSAGETLKVFYSLSEAIVVLIEGTILLSLLVTDFFTRYQIHLGKLRVAT